MSDPPIKRELYSDIIDAGGLVVAVQQSLARNESPLKATGIPESRFPTYARIELHDRFSQVYIAADERLFLFDIWRDGVMYGNGKTANIDEMTNAITEWVGNNRTVSDIGLLGCIQLVDTAHVYDNGNEVEHRWHAYLSRRLEEMGYCRQPDSENPTVRDERGAEQKRGLWGTGIPAHNRKSACR